MSIQEQLPLSLSVLPEYLHHLRSLPPVPRKIHYSWQDPARLLNSSTEIVRRGVRAAIETNPGWDVRIYDDAQMDRIIRSSTLVSASDWTILEREHPVAKVDLLRLILMYEQGGLYSDVDRLFNRDLNQIFGRGTRLLLPTHFDTDFSQDLMATSPGNRLFKNAVELNLARRRSMRHNARGAISGADLLHLGPISYSHALQHGRTAPLAAPQLARCASSGRARRLCAAWHVRGRGRPTGRQAASPGARARRLQSRRFHWR